MSTPDHSSGPRADRPAERALFTGLVDDAAVFPPGLAPLPQAVAEHLARRVQPYADLVGPLLLPASRVAELTHVRRSHEIAIGVIGRPGTDLAVVAQALHTLAADPKATVSGAEIGWAPGWEAALDWGVPLSVEVPRGAGQATALGDVARHTADNPTVQAMLRTGSSGTVTGPSSRDLATFVRACVDHDLGFTLTGGLHHAFTHTSPEGKDQFGFLNVLAATRYALAHAAEVPELETLLLQWDPQPTVDIITRMSEADASVVRAFFTSYGCCGVLDPIRDLSTLGLIEETV